MDTSTFEHQFESENEEEILIQAKVETLINNIDVD